MQYKIYIRYWYGLKIIVREFENKNQFYEWIGRKYLDSLDKIERIDYEVIK